ncbi:hypothetical protein VNI00_001728 [Paramarasmius palmivorus]|uniref:Uncharacterized protein n=1 Tax=Paramarasmius palmivorus TaxID=297713 RepID=A0AAW0E5M5_9AGAR
MNAAQALFHETTSQHAHNLEQQQHSNWWNPVQTTWESWNQPIEDDPPLTKDAMKEREHRYFADQVDDIVPFWIQGVEAAERGGQVSKLSEFLESLENRHNSNVWPPHVHNPWQNPGSRSIIGGRAHGWEQGSLEDHGWGLLRVDWGSQDKSGSSCNTNGRNSCTPSEDQHSFWCDPANPESDDAFNFVEEIATQEAADERRKQKMHSFFELSTDEKVKRIDDLIRTLHSHSQRA